MNLNKLELINKTEGNVRINEIMSEMVKNSNLLPKPVSYKDIDAEMTNFISTEFDVQFGKQDIKTYFFSQQRMSEFTKTWEMVDENMNLVPNFKIVTRENNPKPGTLQGGMFNIPGEPYFTIGTFEKWSGEKPITVSCKMKQPYCVDIIYNIKFVTNRLNLLNELNNLANDRFKSKQCYLIVNGHYMPITLEDVGDESDYDLNEKKIFVQNFQLKVAGYIINEKDIIFEENISRSLVGIEIDSKNPVNNIEYEGKNIIINFPRKSKTKTSFRLSVEDGVSNIVNINADDSNVLSYTISRNGELVDDNFNISKNDRINIMIERVNYNNPSKIILVTN